METKLLIALTMALLTLGCTLKGTQPENATLNDSAAGAVQAPPPALPAQTMSPGEHMESMQYGGYNRTFITYIPASYDGSKPYPLVVVLHGAGGAAKGMEMMTGFNRLADSEGLIVAYPQALGTPGASKTEDPEDVIAWGFSADCCGFASYNGVDDKAFIGAMLDNIESRLNIDREMVYAAGFSNGAGFSYALGCTMADRFAAIAPVEGWMEIGCAPSEPVSVVAMRGTADKSVPYDGGTGPVPSMTVPSARSDMDFWSGFNECTTVENATVANDVITETHSGCRNGTEVLLYTIKGGAHLWSGQNAPNPSNKEIDSSKEIWNFFKSHPKDSQANAAGTDSHETMFYGGYNRTYILHVPESYDGSKQYPLVFVFHGLGGKSETMVKLTGFSEKADTEGFIVVYPQGVGSSWNVGECCGFARTNGIDDIGFVSTLIEDLGNKLSIDKNRVYATGFSNGGMMSYLIGCRLADRFAAIAPVSGAITVDDCSPSRQVPLITFHGTADTGIPYNGGVSSVAANPGSGPPVFKPVQSEVSFWASVNGCSGNSTMNVTNNVALLEYAGCMDGTAVQLYTIQGGTHSWPGSSSLPPSSTDREISATDMTWEFFSEHPK